MNLQLDLNQEQAQAASHDQGPLLVVAGPGTGKTRVITYRIAHLIRQRNVSPDRVLAITFTNKAAQEMRGRVARLLGNTGLNIWMDTFHAACTRILRQYGDRDQLNRHFAIFDQEMQEEILAECLREVGLHPRQVPVWSIRDRISFHKAKLQSIEEADADETELSEEERQLRQVVPLYQQKLSRYQALDFDDLIARAVQLLTNSDKTRTHYHEQLQHILVDEYQDINEAQYQLLTRLIGPERNITVVADADQAIYSWRGSDPSFIERFVADFSPEVIHLETHYRSTQNILRTAQSLIHQNRPASEHSLETQNEPGTAIYHYRVENAEEESRTLIRLIQQLVEQRRYAYGDIAVFYRTHRLADKLEESMAQQRLPIQRVQPTNSFQRDHFREITAYLRYLCWQLDPDLETILNYPRQRIDSLSLARFRADARHHGRRLVQVVESAADGGPGPASRKRVEHLLECLDQGMGFPKDDQPQPMQATRKLMALLDEEQSVFQDVPQAPPIRGLRFAADALFRAIQLGETVHLISTRSVECVLATTLIEQVLVQYLNVAPAVRWLSTESEIETPLPLGTHILVGDYPSLDTEAPIIRIAHEERQAEEQVLLQADNLAFVAFRLMQRLLHYFEATRFDGCTVCAFRFLGQNPARAELIEIAATKLDAAGRGIEHYHTRVRPRSGVPTGWTPEEARRTPSIEAVLPDFVQFVERQILIGHGISEFAAQVLERELRACLDQRPNLEIYDTFEVARRLFPRENCSLAAMADRLGVSYESSEDVLLTASISQKILLHVVRAEQEQQQLSTLEEMLPFVVLASEPPDPVYYSSAVRSCKQHEVPIDEILANVVTSDKALVEERLQRLKHARIEATPQDEQWNALKSDFLNRVLQFEQLSPESHLEGFLDYQSLVTSGDEVKDRNKITLMTLHSAKGTEFPVVIIIGMEEGTFPLYTGDEQLLQEERRLCYVGMTRAKERLYLFSAKRREGDQIHRVSRFIREVPQSYIRYWSAEAHR